MKNFYLGAALISFIVSVVCASYQWHMDAFFSALSAALWFLMYKEA